MKEFKNQEWSDFKWFDTSHIRNLDSLSPKEVEYLRCESWTGFVPFNLLIDFHWEMLLVFFLTNVFLYEYRFLFWGVTIIISIFMVTNIRRLAWNRKNWKSFEAFKKREEKWHAAGIFFFIIIGVIIAGSFLQ